MITPFAPGTSMLNDKTSTEAYFGWNNHIFYFLFNHIGHSEYCMCMCIRHGGASPFIYPGSELHDLCQAWKKSNYCQFMSIQEFLEHTYEVL